MNVGRAIGISLSLLFSQPIGDIDDIEMMALGGSYTNRAVAHSPQNKNLKLTLCASIQIDSSRSPFPSRHSLEVIKIIRKERNKDIKGLKGMMIFSRGVGGVAPSKKERKLAAAASQCD